MGKGDGVVGNLNPPMTKKTVHPLPPPKYLACIYKCYIWVLTTVILWLMINIVSFIVKRYFKQYIFAQIEGILVINCV